MEINLVMFRESGERRDFALRQRVTTVGRKDDCDIRIPLAEVSRHHSQFVVTDKGVRIKDMGSANGTYVNNKRVTEQELQAGDHVVVGPVVFTVQVDGKPDMVRAVKTKLKPLSTVGQIKEPDDSGAADRVYKRDEEIDPISALEALASSADQTAIDPFDDEEDLL